MPREDFKYQKEAKEKLPGGYYVLGANQPLRPEDLVYSWTSHEFLRADSPLWRFSPLVYNEDIICAARRVANSEFAEAVQVKRSFVLRK